MNRWLIVFFLSLFVASCASFEDLDKASDSPYKVSLKNGIKIRTLKKKIVRVNKLPELTSKALRSPFVSGEKIHMDLSIWGITAGRLILETKEDRVAGGVKSRHFRASLRTSPAVGFFFKVDGVADTYTTYKNFFPYELKKNFLASKVRKIESLLLDQKNKKAKYVRETKRSGEEKSTIIKKSWDIPENTQNFISALFYIRKPLFKLGDVFKFYVAAKGKNYFYKFRAIRYEWLEMGGEKIKTILLSAEVSLNGVVKPSRTLVWLTDDVHRYPVKIQAKVKLGVMKGNIKFVDKVDETEKAKEVR